MLMTKARYASHRGCDQKAVYLALEMDRIHAEPNGLIDSSKADREWDLNTDVMRSRILPRESAVNGSARGVQGERQPITMAYLEQRTEQAKVITEAKRLDIDIRKGVLVPVAEMEEAQRQIYGHYRALRDACLELPDRLAPGLGAETDAHVVRDVLWRELVAVFSRFAAETEPSAGEAAA